MTLFQKIFDPREIQPFYHLFAENDDGPYIAYVSQQNLLHDENLRSLFSSTN